MGMINQDMRDVIRRAMLSYVATICEDGSPNLSPKGSVFAYDDDHLIFMNQASPHTVANLRRDPRTAWPDRRHPAGSARRAGRGKP